MVGSTIAREADSVLYTRAGLEIAVASTKAYTTQLMSMYMFSLKLAYAKGRISKEDYLKYVKELQAVPDKAAQVIANKELLQKFAYEHFTEHSVFISAGGLITRLPWKARSNSRRSAISIPKHMRRES